MDEAFVIDTGFWCLFWDGGFVCFAAAVAYEANKPLVIENVEVAPPQASSILLPLYLFHVLNRSKSVWEANVVEIRRQVKYESKS